MADTKFFIKPFAVEGDMDAVPDDMQANGEVSYATGYGFDYERDPATDANVKDIERTKLNAVLYDVTACLRQYQTQGVFPFITAAQNKGIPYSYSKRARCLYAAPGKDLDVYESLVGNNTALPTDATKWIKASAEAAVPPARKITTTTPLQGGGTLEGDLNLFLKAGADGTVLTSRAGAGVWETLETGVGPFRDYNAGTIRMWPSLDIPTLEDGSPLGLSLDGAIVSLTTYPRLARVACPAAENAWAPAWYLCTSAGTRDTAGAHIKLDDWRGGYPQALDLGRGNTQSTVLVKTTSGSAAVTVVNNLSDGGTLLTPKTSTGGIYPGLAVSGAGIPADAKVLSVSGTTVTLTLAATATAASVEMTVTGRVLGSWQWDAARPFSGSFITVSGEVDGVFTYTSVGGMGAASATSWTPGKITIALSRAIPTAPQNRPAGPVAHYIILV